MISLTTTPSAANVVPGAAAYSGGTYSLTGLISGRNYLWTKGANDTNCVVNGSITLTATGVFTATTTSVTLNGSGSTTITAMVSLMISQNLFASTFTPTQPSRQITVGEFPPSNPNWSRQHQVSNEAHFIKRGTVGVAILNTDMSNLALTVALGLTWTPPVILASPSNQTCVGTAYATGTLTGSSSTNVADGDLVTIGTQIYRFKSSMTQVNDVQIGGSGNSDTSLLSLIRAINGTGTPGVDYFASTTANASVTAAASVTSHAFAVTAKVEGIGGNSIATTKTSSVVSWGGTTLAGGTDGSAQFTVVSGSEYALTYQWQYSADGATGWTNATGTVNGCVYTNGTTATLTCAPTTQGQNGYYHRCVVTDNAGSFGLTNGSVNSNSGQLVIT